MPKPKAVIFDLGKVLLDFDYSIAGRKIAARSNLSAADVQEFIDHSPLLCRFETGRIGKEQFFAEVQARTGFRGAIAEFSEFFADIFTPIEPMIKLQDELRRRGVPTWIFSNTNELAVGHIRSRFPFFSRFDGYVFSYECGAMKPDAELYERVEAGSGFRKQELYYIDDRPENIATAARRGWQVTLHETPDRTRAALEVTGLLS